MSNVRVRIAPSPTGYFHIGTARTALFNYLYAKKTGGTFVLRIEDTDKERNTKESEDDIYAQMAWLGYAFDETYIQSQHLDEHVKLLKRLIDTDRAYVSKEEAKDGSGRPVEVVRLRNPGTRIAFTDAIRGEIAFDTTELKDFVIARSPKDPLYHFAVVADDGSAGITHVIRGEEHISNTPRQILIQEALELPRPTYAHIPLILMPDKSKMSKRKHRTAVKDYRAKGYLPDAMNNFLALLGWSAGAGDKELYSMGELIEAFSLEGIHKSGAVFNEEKLSWFNREYLLAMPAAVFEEEAVRILKESLESRVSWNEGMAHSIMPIIKERITIWDDIRTLAATGEFDYFFGRPVLDPAKIPDKKSGSEAAREHLDEGIKRLENASNWDAEAVRAALWEYATEKGRGAVLWPIRYALSGKEKSPDPFVLADILGKDEVLARLHVARDILGK